MFEGLVSFIYYLVDAWGYFGVFLASLIASGTFFFPIPSHLFVFIFSKTLNPFLIALVASLGASLGEFTGYALGVGSRLVVEKKYGNKIKKWEKKAEKYGTFWILVLFAATPLPDDVPGVFAGMMHYNRKKFFLAVFIGKIMMYLAIAYSGKFFLNWIL